VSSPSRFVYLYVDERYVGAIITAWPLRRVLAKLKATNPNGKSHEATVEPHEAPAFTGRTASPNQLGCQCNQCQARRGEDPGR
jgi:hypothetical protein